MEMHNLICDNLGMTRDMSISSLSKGDDGSTNYAFENHNIRILAVNDNTKFSVTNEKSTKYEGTIKGRFLAGCIVGRYLVLFTQVPNASMQAPNGLPDHIYRLEYKAPDQTHSDYWIDVKEFYKGTLNFNADYPIETLGFYESEEVQKVYWVDGLNCNRLINVSDDAYLNHNKLNDYSFDFQGFIRTIPKVTITKDYSKTGYFQAGVLQYFITYYNKYGIETGIIWNSDLQYIGLSDRGAKADEAVSCAFDIDIELESLDPNYEYLRIYANYRSGINGVVSSKIVADLSLKNIESRLADSNDDHIMHYTDAGTTGSTFNADDMPYIGGQDIRVNTLDYKQDTMFAGDIKLPNTFGGINFDELGVLDEVTIVEPNETFKIKEGRISYTDYEDDGHGGMQPVTQYASFINWVYKWVSPIATSGLYQYDNEMLRSQEEIAGFKWREVYRFGIQFLTRRGEWTSAMWIGDKYCNYKPLVFYDSAQYEEDAVDGDTITVSREGTAPNYTYTKTINGVEFEATVEDFNIAKGNAIDGDEEKDDYTYTEKIYPTKVADEFGAITVRVDDPSGDSVRKEQIIESDVEITITRISTGGGNYVYRKTVNGVTTDATAADFQYAKEHSSDTDPNKDQYTYIGDTYSYVDVPVFYYKVNYTNEGCYIPQAVVNIAAIRTAIGKELDSDYVAYRLLVADTNTTNRRILEQGVINPTMFCYADRYYNRPFSIPSWIFRPRTSIKEVEDGNAIVNHHYETLPIQNKHNAELQGIMSKKVPGYTGNKGVQYDSMMFIYASNSGSIWSGFEQWKLIYYESGKNDLDRAEKLYLMMYNYPGTSAAAEIEYDRVSSLVIKHQLPLQLAESKPGENIVSYNSIKGNKNAIIGYLKKKYVPTHIYGSDYYIVSSRWEHYKESKDKQGTLSKWSTLRGWLVDELTADMVGTTKEKVGEDLAGKIVLSPAMLPSADLIKSIARAGSDAAEIALAIAAALCAAAAVVISCLSFGTLAAPMAALTAVAISAACSALAGAAVGAASAAAVLDLEREDMSDLCKEMLAMGYLPAGEPGTGLSNRKTRSKEIGKVLDKFFTPASYTGNSNLAGFRWDVPVLKGEPKTGHPFKTGHPYTAYGCIGEDYNAFIMTGKVNGVDRETKDIKKKQNLFCVDESIVTLNAPDIEDNIYSLTESHNVRLEIVGMIPVEATYGIYDMSTENGLNSASQVIRGKFKTKTLDGSSEHAIGMLNGDIYQDFKMEEANFSSAAKRPVQVTEIVETYRVFMWNRNIAGFWFPNITLTDGTGTRVTSPRSKITHKIFANMRYSTNTDYYTPFNMSIESPVVCMDSEGMLKTLNYGNDKKNYYENVDTISVNTEKYSLVQSDLFYPQSSGAITYGGLMDPVQIRYKQTPHLVLPLEWNKYQNAATILPHLPSEDVLVPSDLYSATDLENVKLYGTRDAIPINAEYNYIEANNVAEILSDNWNKETDDLQPIDFVRLSELLLQNSKYISEDAIPNLMTLRGAIDEVKSAFTSHGISHDDAWVIENAYVWYDGTTVFKSDDTHHKHRLKDAIMEKYFDMESFPTLVHIAKDVYYLISYVKDVNKWESHKVTTVPTNTKLHTYLAPNYGFNTTVFKFNVFLAKVDDAADYEYVCAIYPKDEHKTVYSSQCWLYPKGSEETIYFITKGVDSSNPSSVILDMDISNNLSDKQLEGTWYQQTLPWDKVTVGSPYLFMGELIRRQFDYSSWNGGTSEYALQQLVWNPASKVTLLKEPVKASWGDTFYQRWDCEKTYPFTEQDVNSNVEVLSFMLESHVNLDGRCDVNRGIHNLLNVRPSNIIYNNVYSQKDNFFTYQILDEKFAKTHFESDIVWSLTKNNMDDIDKWTCLLATNEMSLDGRYGTVRKVLNVNDVLVTFQDTGIANIKYNETAALNTTSGLPLQMGNTGKVDGYRMISDTIGCHNKFSINKNSAGVFFADDIGKSFNQFTVNGGIADIGVRANFSQWFKKNLNGNIWTPRNRDAFRTSYDEVTHDLYIVKDSVCVVYNTLLQKFTSFMDYIDTPVITRLISQGGKADSFAIHNFVNAAVENIVDIWKMFAGASNDAIYGAQGAYGYIYGSFKGYSMEYRLNPDPFHDSIFTNYQYTADWTDPAKEVDSENLFETSARRYTTFDTVEAKNEYQQGIMNVLPTINGYNRAMGRQPLKAMFRIWRGDIPRNGDTLTGHTPMSDRMRNPWIHLKFAKTTPDDSKMMFHNLMVNYYNQYGRI